VSNVTIKTLKEVDAIRVACQMTTETLLAVGEILQAGMTTDDIDRFVHEDTVRRGGWPAPLNYHGFPKSVCTSVNEVVCHGIPSSRVLEPGDIINVDVTTIYEGFHGDTSATFYIGKPSADAKHVTEVARRSLDLGIAQVRDGARLGDIGAAIWSSPRARAAPWCAPSSATASAAASTRRPRSPTWASAARATASAPAWSSPSSP